jgi:glycosyltransferase involved in cell wall biosynthesis
MVAEMEATGANVILMKFQRSEGLLQLLKELKTFFKKQKPAIVHVQYLAPGLIPIIAAWIAGVPTIFATVHIAGSIAYGWKGKLLLRTAAKLCTAFFCVSKGVEEFWFGESFLVDSENIPENRRHFTIYNAIDVHRISTIVNNVNRQELRRSLSLHNKRTIGIVGRLAFQKGHAILLDAMTDIIKKLPDVVLVIIGDGPDRSKLEKQAKQIGIEKHIRWLGTKPQERVFELYSIMHVFVMPSLYEGFGLTAAEAMAARLPVLGTKIEGLTEIIEDGVTGYLVPASDSKKLSEGLIDLLTDPEKAREMGEKGFERVKELFSIERFSNSVLTAYRIFQNAP